MVAERRDLEHLLKDVAAEAIPDPAWFDKTILKALKQSPHTALRRLHFHAFCKHGLNDTLLHLIDSRPNDIKEFLSTVPNVFINRFRANETVMVKLLNNYKTEVRNLLHHKNVRNENLLHVLIDKGFHHAINCLIEFNPVIEEYDVSNLCFERNLAGDTPLMTMIPKHRFGNQIMLLWEYMLRNKDQNLVKTITLTNKKGSNLLHLCAENTTQKENQPSNLLKAICHCPRVSEKVLIKALTTERKGKK